MGNVQTAHLKRLFLPDTQLLTTSREAVADDPYWVNHPTPNVREVGRGILASLDKGDIHALTTNQRDALQNLCGYYIPWRQKQDQQQAVDVRQLEETAQDSTRAEQAQPGKPWLDTYYPLDELAALVKVSVSTLAAWVREGKLDYDMAAPTPGKKRARQKLAATPFNALCCMMNSSKRVVRVVAQAITATLSPADQTRVQRALDEMQGGGIVPDPAARAATPPDTRPSPFWGTTTRDVVLASGGTVRMTLSVDWFELSEADRTFIGELIDKVKSYGQ